MKPRFFHPFAAPFSSLAFFAAVISFTATSQLGAAIITWDGGVSAIATDLGTAANWAGDALPSTVTPDTAEWNGTVAGPLALVYSNNAFAGAIGNGGVNLSLAATQTSALNIDAGANTASLRMGNLTIAAGAGAFSLGDSLNVFSLTLGGAASTQTWVNNSSNSATIGSEIVWGLGGGGAHILAVGGSGNWDFNNAMGQGNGVLTVTKSGAGVANLNGVNTYTGATNVTAGTLNYKGSLGLTGTAAAAVSVGIAGGGNASLNVSTSSNLKLNNTNLVVGLGITSDSGQGFVHQSGGTIAGVNQLQIGAGASGSSYGYYQVSGGTLGMQELDVGGFNGASTGVFELTAGTVNVSAWIVPSRGVSGVGIMNMTGGTLNFTGPAGQFLANWGGGAGSVTNINVANSNLIAAPANLNLMQTDLAGKLATVNLLGGGLMQVNSIAIGSNLGTTLVNFNGGTLKANTANTTFLAANLTGAYVYANGGTIDNNGVAITIPEDLQAPAGNGVGSVPVTTGGSGYLGAPAVTFSGGDGSGASAYAVISGGAVSGIVVTNPGTGYATAPTAILTGGGGTGASVGAVSLAANASGGLTFTGNGSTTLTGVNTYTGPTLVSAGTLRIADPGTLNATSGIAINGPNAKLVHAALDPITRPVTLTQGTVDGFGVIQSLTIANLATNTVTAGDNESGVLTVNSLTFQGAASINIHATGTSTDRTIEAGALATSSSGKVTVNATNSTGTWIAGVYPVIEYATFSGTLSDFVLGTVPGLSSRQTASIINTNGTIALRIVGDPLTWTGRQNANWGTTAVGGSFNWAYPSNNQTSEFANADSVLFNDNAQRFTVNLTSDVAPASVVFDNSSKDYKITGSGFGITTGSLVKNGSSTVTLATQNTYTGSTTINDGVLQLGDGTADGSIATSGLISVNGFGSLVFNLTGSHTYANPIAGSNTAILSKLGSGTLTLAGANTFTGNFTLEAGQLNLNSPGALGNGPGNFTINGGGLDNTSGAAVTSVSTKPLFWNSDFTFVGSSDLSLGTGAITLAGEGSGRSVSVNGATFSTGALNGPGYDFTKAGTGTLRVRGGTLTGKLTVQAGIFGTSEDFFATGLTGPGTFENGSTNTKWSFWSIAEDQTSGTLIQNGAGTGLMGIVKRGAATWTLTNNANNATANLTVDNGKLVLNNTGIYGVSNAGGTLVTNLTATIGNNATANGVLEINGATVNYNTVSNVDALPYRGSLAVGNNASGAGAVHMGSGSLTVYRQLSLGNVGGAFGGYSQSGGTASVGGFLALGLGNANGVFNQSGGTFTMTAAPVTNGAGTGSTGVMNLSGSAVFNQNPAGDLGIWLGETGTGMLNISGNAALNFAATNNGLQLGRAVAGIGIANLLGGNVTTARIAKGAGTGTLNFNGGTLTANAASTTFLTGLTNTFVHAGGGTVNNGGNAITIGQALLAPVGNGVSATGLTVSGTGFVETPIVQITGDGNGATSIATIDAAGNLTGITVTNPGSGYTTPPTFTLLGGGIGNTGFIDGTATLVSENAGGMSFVGTGLTTLGAINTYKGNTTVGNGSILSVSAGAALQFAPKANGISNKVTGSGTAAFYGSFNIDLTGAAIAGGNSWTLVDVTNRTFDTLTFAIPGFTQVADVWTKVDGGNTWTFTEATGVLSLQSSGVSGYAAWAAANAGNGGANGDFDNDGVSNGLEYFMGASGSSFTANPGIVNGRITWPKDPAYSGTFTVQTSPNLVTWTNVPSAIVGNTVEYTPAVGQGKVFVRLVVTPN